MADWYDPGTWGGGTGWFSSNPGADIISGLASSMPGNGLTDPTVYSAANPGMFGGGPEGTSNPSQGAVGGSDPLGSSSGTDWKGLAAGMKDIAGGLKTAGQQQAATQQKLNQLQQAQASPGQPRAPVSLDALVRLLQQRQQMYQQAAMSPGAKPVAPQTVQGLLGF